MSESTCTPGTGLTVSEKKTKKKNKGKLLQQMPHSHYMPVTSTEAKGQVDSSISIQAQLPPVRENLNFYHVFLLKREIKGKCTLAQPMLKHRELRVEIWFKLYMTDSASVYLLIYFSISAVCSCFLFFFFFSFFWHGMNI